MIISTKPEGFIINMAHENGGKVISNFLLHGLKIKNDSDKNIMLKNIDFELYTLDTLVKQIVYQGKSLSNVVKEFAENCTWLGKGFGAKLFLGEEGFWNPEYYADSVGMKPDQETGIFNEYFIVIYDKVIDRLAIKVNYLENGAEREVEFSIPLVRYKNKNQYIFPLKGSISTCGNYNTLPEHRQHYSMEFAFDMAQYNVDQKLCYKENMCEEDYIVYCKDIFAIADGEVIDCHNSFSMTTSWDWNKRKPLIDKYGLAAQCGNYIVLRHENEEYSFYGHLAENSLTIKKGDRIKKGQVIAKVGNTGLSNCPHLHFQLMDGPDFLSARGLPCSFSNITDAAGNKLDFIQEENIIIHAE